MENAKTEVSSVAPLRGDVKIYVRKADTGELISKYEIRNTIVYNGLNAVIRLLAQNSGDPAPNTLNISFLAVGTGTVAPTRADTALGTQVIAKTLVSADRVESLATGQLTITKTLGTGDADGNTLTEAGLLLADSSLFARQIFPGIPKTSGISVTIEWLLGFTS